MSQDLFRRAVEKAGNQTKLAQYLNKPLPRLSEWKRGEPMPDEVIAALAAYVGEDPIQALAVERGGLWGKVAGIVGRSTPVPGMVPSVAWASVAAALAAAAERIMYIM